jgi:hypothetical protein
MRDVVAWDDGLLAVGSGRGQLFVGTMGCTGDVQCPAEAWTSDDGSTWTRVSSSEFAGEFTEASRAAASDDVVVAVGFDLMGAMWVHETDSGWRRVPSSGPVFGDTLEIRGVVVHDGLAMALGYRVNWAAMDEHGGFSLGDAAVWVSGDGGRTWERAPYDSAFGRYDGPFTQMTAGIPLGDNALLIVGSSGGQAAVWTATWNEL